MRELGRPRRRRTSATIKQVIDQGTADRISERWFLVLFSDGGVARLAAESAGMARTIARQERRRLGR